MIEVVNQDILRPLMRRKAKEHGGRNIVPGFSAIIGRFPDQELAIRRLCRKDVGFLGSCQDYEEASIALRHWERAGEEYAVRVREYRQLLSEIESEILEELSSRGPRVSNHDEH